MLLYRNDVVRAGALPTTAAPTLYFYSDDSQRVAPGTPFTAAFHPFDGGRRLELGGVFVVEGSPSRVTFALDYGGYAATVMNENGAWIAQTASGPIVVADDALEGDAWRNVAVSGSFGDGEYLPVVVNGTRRGVTVTPDPPDEPTWPDPDAIVRRHFGGLDDSNLARTLASSRAQGEAMIEAQRAEWFRQHGNPKPVPAGLAEAEDLPVVRFSITVEGPKDAAIVLDRSWGVAL